MPITVAQPSSDLVTSAHPYRLRILAMGMEVRCNLTLGREGEAPITTETMLPVREGSTEMTIDGGLLAEGEYRGEISVTSDAETATVPLAFCRLPELLDEPFPFAVYEAIFDEDDPAQWETALATMQAAGVNVVCQHMGGMGRYAPVFDRAARRGIRFMPSDNLHQAHIEPDDSLLARMNRLEEPTTRPQFCMNQSAVREAAAAALARNLEEYRAHPDFSGMVYYGDDLFMRLRSLRGEVGISCYCEHCRADFAAQTGQEAPATTAPVIGIVPDDHPWLRWMRYRCGEAFGGFIGRLEEAKTAVDASIRMGLCHGWPHQPFSNIASGIYGPLTQPTAVVSSYAYPYLRSPRADLICHYAMGAMGQRDKDIWMLGAFNSNKTLYPAWQVYQNYWNMLAAGYRFIGFFSWWDLELARRRGEDAAVAEELAALARCGAHGAWILPTAKAWRVPPAPFAVLYSFTTEAFDIEPANRAHLHSERVLALQRLALQRGVPLEVLCEEEAVNGWLDRYEVICLVDVRVLPASVQAALAAYVERGGTVFVENDLLYCDWESPAVRVPGALEVSPETMIALLADRHAPEVTSGSPHVTARTLEAGAVRYHVFVNNFTDQYWGMPFHYDSPARNAAAVALVRDESVVTTVHFAGENRWLFDVETGEQVGTTDQPVPLALEPSWGRVWAALPCPCAELAVEVPEDIRQGDILRITLEMRDGTGACLPGAFSARVTLTAPCGRMSGASGFVGLADGRAEIAFSIGLNAEMGAWILVVEGGFPRAVQAQAFTVGEAEAPVALMR